MSRLLHITQLSALLSLCLTLVSCAANPVRVNVAETGDTSLNCSQLGLEIKRAEQYKVDARKDDRFRLQDIIPTTGMMSIYNINKAESNATKRIEHLQTLYQQKRCHEQQQVNYNPTSVTPAPTHTPTGSAPMGYIPNKQQSNAPSMPQPLKSPPAQEVYGYESEMSPYDLNTPSLDDPYPVR